MKKKKMTRCNDPFEKNSIVTSSRNKMDPSQENSSSQVQWSKNVNIRTPITRFLCNNPIDLNPSQIELDMIARILNRCTFFNEATSYPSILHISRAIDMKMVRNRTYPRLPICDEGKKKGFKIYFNMEMPNREQKVDIVSYPRDQKTLFRGNKLVCKLDSFDARTSWNQIVWFDTPKASTPSSNVKDLSDHKDSIQVLRPTKVYNFDDACACFVKNHHDGFITRLKILSIIFNKIVFNLNQMDERVFKDHVMLIHKELKPRRKKWKHSIKLKKLLRKPRLLPI